MTRPELEAQLLKVKEKFLFEINTDEKRRIMALHEEYVFRNASLVVVVRDITEISEIDEGSYKFSYEYKRENYLLPELLDHLEKSLILR